MFHKKVAKPLALTLGIGVSIGASIDNIDALVINAVNRDQLLSKIRITDPKGNVINNFNNISTPMLPITTKSELGPCSWGDFISKTSSHYNINSKFLLDYNITNEEAIITKPEIFNSLKLLLETSNGVKLTSTSNFKLERLINVLNSGSNYIRKNDLDNLVGKSLTINEKGELVEKFVGKINNFKGQFLNLLRTELYGSNTVESYKIDYRAPWQWDNSKVYEFSLEGNSIVYLEPISDLKYGIVRSNGNQNIVEDKVINSHFNVKSGDYIEYYENEGEITVTENYGSYEGSFVVEDTSSRYINTYEDERLRVRDIKLIDKDGLPVNKEKLTEGSIISKFGDYIVLHNDKSSHSIRVHDDYIYIDNVVYGLNSIWVDTGSEISKSSDLDYKEYIDKGEVYWDLFGNPIKIDIPKLNKVGTYEGEEGDKIVLNIDGKESEYYYSEDLDRLSKNRYYNFIIIDETVVDAENLKSFTTEVDTLHESYFYNGRTKVRVEPDTPILEITNSKEEKYITYDDLFKKYEDEIKSGYLEFRVYYVSKSKAELIEVEYKPAEGLSDSNYLRKTPLNVYKLENIRRDSNQVTLELFDGFNRATIKTSEDEIDGNVQSGNYVVAEFSSRGVLEDLYNFILNEDNILTDGLAGYLKLSNNSVQNQIIYDSEEYNLIKNSKLVYRFKNNDTLEILPKEEPMRVGGEYYILEDKNVIKLRILANN